MKRYACLFFPAALESPRLASLAEACLRFSSQVALRPDEAVLLESGKSRWLYGQASLGLRLQRLAQRENAPCRVRFGDSPAEALALARFSAEDPLRLPLEALSDYASPFKADEGAHSLALSLAPPLRALGLGSLGDVLALPLHSLGSRFGPQAALLRQRVAGHWDMAWPRYTKKELPSEAFVFAENQVGGACASLEQLGFAVRLLCERLCARLRGRNERLGKLRFALKLDVFPRKEPAHLHWDLSLPLSLGEARELHRVLRSALEGWLAQGLPGPAVLAELQALELVPGSGGQRNFFERREEELEAYNAVVDRLRLRLGPDQVFLAELVQRYLPEGAWKKVLKEPPSHNNPRRDLPLPIVRPTRLLRQAQPLLRAGDRLALAKGRQWETLSWQGPERLQGEWWQGQGFARDYYRVQTQEGPDLWVYHALPLPLASPSALASPAAAHGAGAASARDKGQGFWLHGFFD